MAETGSRESRAASRGTSGEAATEGRERARPRSYSAASRARILAEYDGMDKAGKGAGLRREGLYRSLVSEWRKQRERGGMAALAQPVGRRRPSRAIARSPGWRFDARGWSRISRGRDR
ncbi:MAG TPA: hypothetical protein VNN74_11570 [Candidatus Micrarchaeia archaeon]|nr:hypothetical protein [Candidatus Micrarchaeia archaeon]